ncbi:hypothetical protein CMMCAS03_14690 [Clavibacter michiganensis subsp. michiganensis]|nr:hypothetical protein CMMCAS03_14690 [Clavibacter michiganensis subsp. michiganensis]
MRRGGGIPGCHVDHQLHVGARQELERVGEEWDPEVAAAERPHVGEVEASDPRVDAPQALEGVVVDEDDLAVAGDVDVDLDRAGAGVGRRADGRERVLAVPRGVAAVGGRCRHRASPVMAPSGTRTPSR